MVQALLRTGAVSVAVPPHTAPTTLRDTILTQANAVRGLAILIVAWSHALYALGGFTGLFFYQAGDLGVSMFLFLSGFLLSWRQQQPDSHRSWRTWYLRRLRRVMIPYWSVAGLWLVADMVLLSARPRWAAVLVNVLGFQYFGSAYILTEYYWFITVILCLYAAFPLLAWLAARPLPQATAIGFGLTVICGLTQTLTWTHVGSFFPGVAVFFWGMLTSRWLSRENAPLQHWSYLATALAMGYTGMRGLQYVFRENLIVQWAMWTLLPFAGMWAVGTASLIGAWLPRKLQRVLGGLGLISYEIYLLHVVHLDDVFALLGTTVGTYALWFGVVVGAAWLLHQLTNPQARRQRAISAHPHKYIGHTS
ncbi:MAG: acyltransferase [Anaerolineae bacterium]|nr:acyltransferase [Anaerolineae bacterium]